MDTMVDGSRLWAFDWKAPVFIVVYLRKDYVEWMFASFRFFSHALSLSLSLSLFLSFVQPGRWKTSKLSSGKLSSSDKHCFYADINVVSLVAEIDFRSIGYVSEVSIGAHCRF